MYFCFFKYFLYGYDFTVGAALKMLRIRTFVDPIHVPDPYSEDNPSSLQKHGSFWEIG
jgi:hypothetical protein